MVMYWNCETKLRLVSLSLSKEWQWFCYWLGPGRLASCKILYFFMLHDCFRLILSGVLIFFLLIFIHFYTCRQWETVKTVWSCYDIILLVKMFIFTYIYMDLLSIHSLMDCNIINHSFIVFLNNSWGPTSI